MPKPRPQTNQRDNVPAAAVERHRARGRQWTRRSILATLRSHLPRLSEELGVRRIALFGSHARGAESQGSDIDLLAELDEAPGLRFVELVEELESLFGTRVDLLTPAGVGSICDPQTAANIRRSLVYA